MLRDLLNRVSRLLYAQDLDFSISYSDNASRHSKVDLYGEAFSAVSEERGASLLFLGLAEEDLADEDL